MSIDKSVAAAALSGLLSRPVLIDEPMAGHTTWKLGGPADLLVEPASGEELAAVLSWLNSHELPWTVVGNGSNLLVGDKGVRGVVIRMGEAFSGATWRGPEVEVRSGMLLAALALEAAERSLSGLEFARGIPGSVGGGLRMNCGAYDHNIGPLVQQVEGVTYQGQLVTVDGAQISFAYRNSSLFQLDAVITKVRLRLTPGDREEIMGRMREYLQRRSLAQPLESPSCGSVFRNPPGDHAGHLIEMAGLRGTAIGGMEVSQKHGNFIINRGSGTAAQARELMELVQQQVFQFAGVRLEPEVRFLGEF